MNTTRTVVVPVAFLAGSAAVVAVVPAHSLDRIVPASAGAVAAVASHLVAAAGRITSDMTSSPAFIWTVIGLATLLVLGARLAMGAESNPDEHEGFDVD